MNKPFDPHGSHDAHRVVDEAVARGPQPLALGNLDFLARQQNQDEPGRGRFADLFKRDKATTPTQEAPAEPKKKGMSRRAFLGKAALGAAGAYGVYRGIDAVYAPKDYHLALLKMDDTTKEMGVVHRGFSMNDTNGTVETAKTSLEGLSAGSLAGDGLESLVVSPEIELQALSRKRNPSAADLRHRQQHQHDAQEISLDRTTKNIYLPYHLFENARDFRISKRIEQEIRPWDGILNAGEREQMIDGERKKVVLRPRLQIAIFGYPEKEDVPITQDITSGATNAKDAAGDAVTGLGTSIANGWDYLTGNEDRATRRANEREEGIRNRETAKPHPQVDPKFILSMDYIDDAHLPDLHFFNGRTLDAPTDRVRHDEIATAIAKDPREGLRLITNNGLNCDAFVNGGVCMPQGVRYTDADLQKAAHDASVLTDSRPENGFLKDAWSFITRHAVEDNKLSEKETGGLIMATRFQQMNYDQRMDTSDGRFTMLFGEHGRPVQGFANRLAEYGERDTITR